MKRKNIALLVLSMILAVCLLGCVSTNTEIEEPTLPVVEDPLELIIILGSHRNAWLSLDELYGEGEDAAEFAELIARTMEYGEDGKNYTAKAHVKVMVCDGSPTQRTMLTLKGKELVLYESSPNRKYISVVHEDLADNIAKALERENMYADDAEVDLVSALIEASYLFESGDEREKMIYIMDTGLCTAGPLNMLEKNIQELTVDEIMLMLNSGEFADLEGIHVEFRNFGDFCGKQPVVKDNTLWKTLTSLWETYLEKCGVESCDVRYNGNEYDPATHTYNESIYKKTVSEVPFEMTIDGFTLRPRSAPFDPVKDANLILNDETVGGFSGTNGASIGLKPNDENAARQIAAEQKRYYDVVTDIYPECVFYVVGSCSYGNDNVFKDTAEGAIGRAITIKQYLIDAGIPADRVVAVDAGMNELLWRNAHETDEKPQNRVVAIIPSYRTEIVNYLNGVLGDDRVPRSND